MRTARKRRSESKSRAPRAKRSAARTTLVAPLADLNTRLGARTEYRIYPSVGIARIGDCKDTFMIGPEAPGMVPPGSHRGADKGIKPQAARFRIYKVDIDANENEVVTEEVIAGNDVKFEWSASLANRKAAGLRIADTLARKPSPRTRNDGLDRDKLVIAATGSVTGSGTSGPVLLGAIEFAKPRAKGLRVTDIVLATLRTDEEGRLLVLGGPGKSESPLNASINSFSDNDGWYDSVSDGPVSAQAQHTWPSLPRRPGLGRGLGAPIRSRNIRHRHLVRPSGQHGENRDGRYLQFSQNNLVCARHLPYSPTGRSLERRTRSGAFN
jgi:hypothetical protein